MRLYVHMMLCGSICTLTYIFFNRILPYELPLKWRRLLIRINIAFYLLPVPWLAAEGKELSCWLLEKAGMIFARRKTDNTFDAASVWDSFIVLNEDGRIMWITGIQKLLPILLPVLCVCVSVLAGWLFLYMWTSSKYRKNMVFLDTGDYAKHINTKVKVAVGVCPCVTSPLTVGLVKPVILFPVDYHKYENAMEAVLLHELNHVLCADIVERFFCFMVVVIHFWNPLAYNLLREHVAVSEMLGDEAAVKGRSKKQKADYIRCIMEASQKTNHGNRMVLSLGKTKSLLRKRMEQIMESNKKKKMKKWAAAVVVSLCALAGSIPALAYEKPREYVQCGGEDWNENDILVFSQTGEKNPLEGNFMDFSHGETLFVSGDGKNTEYIMIDNQIGQLQNICAHSYISGTIAEHVRHTDGSCTVVTYQAQKCTKCGSAVSGDEIAVFTYKSCPHAKTEGTVSDENESMTSTKAVVNVVALRVRSEADYNASVQTLLKEGEVLTIVEEDGDFYKVMIPLMEGRECMEGYVGKAYVDLLTE